MCSAVSVCAAGLPHCMGLVAWCSPSPPVAWALRAAAGLASVKLLPRLPLPSPVPKGRLVMILLQLLHPMLAAAAAAAASETAAATAAAETAVSAAGAQGAD